MQILCSTTLLMCRMLLLLFLCLPGISNGQARFVNQQMYGVEEGLPQSYVSGISQDKDGFIWVSTLDGLSRYDGRNFKTFRYQLKDSSGLSANAIYYLLSRDDNQLVLMYDGMQADRFDMESFRTTRLPLLHTLRHDSSAAWNVNQIRYAFNGADWCFLQKHQKGAGWVNGKTGKISYASHSNGLLQQDSIFTFFQHSDGRLFLVSADGVQVSDTAKKHFDFIRFNTQISQIAGISPREEFAAALFQGNQLVIYNGHRLLYLHLHKKTSSVQEIPTNGSTPVPGSHSILKTDHTGLLYFEHQGRILRVEKDGSIKQLWQNNVAPSLHVTDFYVDRSEVLWVSVNAQGLIKVDLHAQPFLTYRYKRNFAYDLLEHAGVSASMLPVSWSSPFASYFMRTAFRDKESFYCGLEGNELFLYENGKFQRLSNIPANAKFSMLLCGPGGALWALDQQHSCWYVWNDLRSTPEKIAIEPGGLKDVVPADARYVDGSQWISTYSQGLLQFRGGQLVKRFSGQQANGLMPNELTEICVNPANKDQLWIGSRGSGLILWDTKLGLQQVLTTENGLPNNTIYCILPDDNGRIWCSTNNGIFRLDPTTREIRTWTRYDGLQGNEFNRSHKFRFADGHMAFGGLEGYTILNPADFNKKLPVMSVTVQLTSVQINNEVQDHLNEGSLIEQPLSLVSSIELPYNKNYLRLEFAAMLFNQPQNIRYRYQLKGADAGWVDNGTSNVVTYAALRPGSYTLLLNATDNNGNWSSAIRSITVLIHPPLWATWWAWIIYALVAFVLIRWLFAAREKRLKAEQKLAYEKREALRLREMDEVKDRFFSNITHEFRTPLTLIITPLERLRKDPDISPASAGMLKIVNKNARHLLQLINEFLDFSKLNSGQMKLNLSSGELGRFVRESVMAFSEMAAEKEISLHFETEVEGYYLFDEDKWEKIIQNLLSNAVKFAPLKGSVAVKLIQIDDNMLLEVCDNGPGIPAASQQRIFERFYQAQHNIQGGTGIGLALVKEFTTLMKGTIELESHPGNTRFRVRVPVQRVSAAIATASPSVLKPEKSNSNEYAPLILIVEDNPELRSFLADGMRTNYRVLEASNGAEAWDTVLRELPELVISDVMMPEKDGFDLCQLVKSDPRTAHIGFILLTSKAAQDARLKGLSAGADDYITKPFSQDELDLRVANLLQLQQKLRSHLRQQLIAEEPQDKLPAVKDPLLLQLYEEMDRKLDAPELTVDYLAKICNMSRSTLNRKLRALLDISPNDFIRQYRLQKASVLLKQGQDISAVAYRVGFSSPSYFTQCFREQFGITPSDYVSASS